MTEVRTRIAPSPTGDPHVGTAYVALFNRAFARRHGGRFLLRIEDTDRVRSHPAAERMIFDALRWLGLDWDEGPDVGGPHGPYRQSERGEIYREHAQMLVANGSAYPCFCTAERLAELREEQKKAKAALGYDGACRQLERADARRRRDAGEPHVVRLAMPREGDAVVPDLLRGDVRIPWTQVDDQVLLKSDGFPTYHLANVVDDHLMAISHVIRAEEWLSSLPKHARLYEAFGWQAPVFCHLPLLRNADRSKISKRKNPVSLNHYRRAGYLPEALLNYLALMGFSMGEDREEFTVADFEREIDLPRVSLGGPVFDLAKLAWLNGRYLRKMAPVDLVRRLREGPLSEQALLEVVPLVQERADTLEDLLAYAQFFFVGEVAYDDKAMAAMVPKGMDATAAAKALSALVEERFDPLLEWTAETVEAAVRSFAEGAGLAPKDVFMMVRVAATGRPATPPLPQTLAVLGKEICRRRLRAAAAALRGGEKGRR